MHIGMTHLVSPHDLLIASSSLEVQVMTGGLLSSHLPLPHGLLLCPYCCHRCDDMAVSTHSTLWGSACSSGGWVLGALSPSLTLHTWTTLWAGACRHGHGAHCCCHPLHDTSFAGSIGAGAGVMVPVFLSSYLPPCCLISPPHLPLIISSLCVSLVIPLSLFLPSCPEEIHHPPYEQMLVSMEVGVVSLGAIGFIGC